VTCDLFNEKLISPAIYLHPTSDASTGVGDFSYEAPQSIAATAADSDGSYLTGRVVRGVLWCCYRTSASTTHANRMVAYDMGCGRPEDTDAPEGDGGLDMTVRPDGRPWGWSTPLTRTVALVSTSRSATGESLYGWNSQNAGTGDGRIDEIETGTTDNGSSISASLTLPWFRFEAANLSAQEIIVEHSTPTGATVALDFHRSYTDTTYSMTPSSTSTPVVSRDLKMLALEARSPTAACYIGWRQSSTGSPSELRHIILKAKRLKVYKT
jgi:hypothetical protein